MGSQEWDIVALTIKGQNWLCVLGVWLVLRLLPCLNVVECVRFENNGGMQISELFYGLFILWYFVV